MAFVLKDLETIRDEFYTKLKAYAIENSKNPYITDFNVGSTISILTEAFSSVLEDFYYQLYQITKDSIENIYNGFNFYRISGKKAFTTVRIYLPSVTSVSDVNNPIFFNIPKSTVVSTDDGTIEFESIVDYSVGRLSVQAGGEFNGKVYYEFDAISKSIGSIGNIATNSLTKITSSIMNNNNLSTVVRNDAAAGGFDEEEEEFMKKRFQKYLVSLRRGTKEAIEFALQTNVNFSGFLYNIDEYKSLYMLKQGYVNYAMGSSSNVFTDLYYDNKFTSSYTLLDRTDAQFNDGTLDFALYFGTKERFYSLLSVTETLPVLPGVFVVGQVSYWNGTGWTAVDDQSPTNPTSFSLDQYITWTINNPTLWEQRTIQKYTGYFVRITFGSNTGASVITSVSAIKTMTYPFPGYVDIYCLKNFKYFLTDLDKEIVAEALENYKAAGVITSIGSASIINLYPIIVIYTLPGGQPPPSTVLEDIRNDIRTYSGSLNVATDFNRNDLYALIYRKYSNYGSIFIYYNYDNSLYETGLIYKEFYKNVVLFDASKNEKIDFPFVDVYILDSLNYLDNVNIVTDIPDAASGVDYDDVYGNLSY